MPANVDHLLLVGFGGPTSRAEVRPFLERVTRGLPIPPARIGQVEHQYEQAGGFSPYNAHAMRLAQRVAARLRELNAPLPVLVGMRQWNPLLAEILAQAKREELLRGVAFVLAPHRSPASYDKYVETLDQARTESGWTGTYRIVSGWHADPSFVSAQADRVKEVMSGADPRSTRLLFTAHSIPEAMAARCGYAAEFRETAERVAQVLGWADWEIAYQSRSGNPREPWLGPDVLETIRRLKGTADGVLLVPAGFLFDHTEVLFDLDIQARAEAEGCGLVFRRASTVMDHPSFVELIARRAIEAG